MLFNTLSFPILLAFLASFVAAVAPRRLSAWVGAGAALCAAIVYGVNSDTASTQPLAASFWTVPSLTITGNLYLDGLAALFALLICGIGCLIFIYTHRYLANDPRQRRLVVMLLLFMTSMLGAVTADDVIVLFIFWELTSLTSFFLVGYDHEDETARKAALQALLVTAGGGLALLAGLILMALAAGTTSLSTILQMRTEVLAHPASMAAMCLIVLGCFTKSAQFPFHFWLPNAMAAPTPVSAYLHSATMVKLGIYLLARLTPLYSGVLLWHNTLALVGLATALVGTLLAFRVTDLKRILAYTTIAALGLLTMLLGIGTEIAIVAALTFLIVHAFYKASLFLVAGIVDHETGVRDLTQLAGLRRAMPVTATVAAFAALSMAGVPPFLGFVSKELMYESVLHSNSLVGLLTVGTFWVNVGAVAIGGLLSVRVFGGRVLPTPVQPHDPAAAMLIGPLLLAGLGLLASLALPMTAGQWILPAASATRGHTILHDLALWHGITPLLGLSALTIGAGALVYWGWPAILRTLQRFSLIDRLAPSRAYDAALAGLLTLAHRTTLIVQSGSLRTYIRVLFGVAAAVLLTTLIARDALRLPVFTLDLLDVRYLMFVGLIVGAWAAATANTAFKAVIATGLVGFASALIFLLFGAPDVSFTQFSVETLLVVIIATTLARLPIPTTDARTKRQKLVDAGIAIATGAAISLVLLAVVDAPLDLRLTEWFGEHSLNAAHGRNVVNVILVDFRALDTLGETTVLAIAAFAVHALLRAARAAKHPKPGVHEPSSGTSE